MERLTILHRIHICALCRTIWSGITSYIRDHSEVKTDSAERPAHSRNLGLNSPVYSDDRKAFAVFMPIWNPYITLPLNAILNMLFSNKTMKILIEKYRVRPAPRNECQSNNAISRFLRVWGNARHFCKALNSIFTQGVRPFTAPTHIFHII